MSVIKFRQSYRNLLDLAYDAEDKKEDFKQIALYRRAIRQNPKNAEAYFRLAEVLSDVGLVAASNRLLFRALTLDSEDPDFYLLLGENNFSRSEWHKAGYYFRVFSEMDDGAEDYDFTPLYEAIQSHPNASDKPRLKLVGAPEERKELERKAKKLLASGEFDQAGQVYRDIMHKNPNDLESANFYALTKLLEGEVEESEKVTRSVLEKDAENLSALSDLAILQFLKGEQAELQQTAEKLIAFPAQEQKDRTKVIATLCQIQRHEAALQKTQNYLAEYPFDTDVLFMSFYASFNCRRFTEAKNTLLRILDLDDCLQAAKFYLHLTNDVLEGKAEPSILAYSPQVPTEEVVKRVMYLQKSKSLKEIWTDPLRKEIADWAFYTLTNLEFLCQLVGRIAGTQKRYYLPYFEELLLNETIADEVKAEILCVLLKNGKEHVFYVADGIFSELETENLAQGKWLNPLCRAVSTMAFVLLFEEDFASRFRRTAEELAQKQAATELALANYSEFELAAYLVVRSGVDVEREEVCGIFRVEYDKIRSVGTLFDGD